MISGGFTFNHLEFLLAGAVWTICLSLISLIGGGLAGGVVAFLRISPIRLVRWLSYLSVPVIQGTPLLVLLFVAYFGLSLAVPTLTLPVSASVTTASAVVAFSGTRCRCC